MGTNPIVQLTAANAKQRGESLNFEAFRKAHPNFAGRALVRTEWGGDPPDILCYDPGGKRIGVELVQWINQSQMAESKARFELQDSYQLVIGSTDEEPPKHIGIIFIYTKTHLAPQDAATFRTELYRFINQVDSDWHLHPEWDDPQGWPFTDFAGYPSLAEHLDALDVYARGRRFDPSRGARWIAFRPNGGAYTSDWMRDALLNNIKRKTVKYNKPANQLKLQTQQLNELYLLAYYDEAVLHNTPYDTPGFGFREIAAQLNQQLTASPHPFDKVFLYSPLETTPVLQVWPTPSLGASA